MRNHYEVRQAFLDFFKDKEHTVVSSSPLFLPNDPSLLFVNAGMNQFKDIFTGKTQAPPFKRATNTQKCLRVSGKHNDLDDVGVDHYHHTFFEMLGSWSFADYSKKEAILWAWELITQIYKLDQSKLWATVYETDEESAQIWRNQTNINKEHVLYYGKQHNFWSMGDIGPCGPCSEIHYDLGLESCSLSDKPHNCSVNGDCGRYVELWNLVFMEYEQTEDGKEKPLSKRYVDTGMGLERIVRVLQKKHSNYDTDLFVPIFNKIEELSQKQYKNSTQEEGIAFRVIADHIRALCFSIADGVIPSNTGRGYVIRRILRRAYRYGKTLNMPKAFLSTIASVVIETMGSVFRELKLNEKEIISIIADEEEKFYKTLEIGLLLFEKEVSKLKDSIITGKLAFLLFDTYGFPIDLTILLAKEKGYTVDTEGFEVELDKQKKLSQSQQKFFDKKGTENFSVLQSNITKTNFIGYEHNSCEDASITKFLKIEDMYQIVLDKTPFYAEGGGQVSDKGVIYSKNFSMQIEDVQKTPEEYIHYGYIKQGVFNPNDTVIASINIDRRQSLRKHHTGVHILHTALNRVLNTNIEYHSNYVGEDYFYVDIVYPEKLREEQLTAIEKEMNLIIQSAFPVYTHCYNSIEEVNEAILASGRFNDRIEDKDITRAIEVKGVTTDLCGGTHVSNTGELGVFKIIGDISAGSNIRHLECMCGMKAWEAFNELYKDCKDISYDIKCSVKEVPGRVKGILEENKNNKKEIRQLQVHLAEYKYTVESIVLKGSIKSYPFYIGNFVDADMSDIRRLANQFLSKNPDGILFLYTSGNTQLYTLCCHDSLLAKGFNLQDTHTELITHLSIKGGGKGSIFNGSITHPSDFLGENSFSHLLD